jgi:sugar/nucleoside kinase (ribokinase family)
VGGSRRFAAHIDVFLPNEGEALAITGETDVGKAAKTIANMGPLTA